MGADGSEKAIGGVQEDLSDHPIIRITDSVLGDGRITDLKMIGEEIGIINQIGIIGDHHKKTGIIRRGDNKLLHHSCLSCQNHLFKNQINQIHQLQILKSW